MSLLRGPLVTRVTSFPVNDGRSDSVTRRQCRNILKVCMVVAIVLMFVAHIVLKRNDPKGLKLTLLYTSDINGRIQQFDKYLGTCTGEGEEEGEGCFGGMARMYSAVQQVRAEKEHALLVDGGDRFTGTMWFEHYKGFASSVFMNMMKYDVMTLGCREFDLRSRVLSSLIGKLRFPVVNANVDFTGDWPEEEKFHLISTIKKFENTSVGIIGFSTQETAKCYSSGSNVTFRSIIPSVKKEVNKLKNQGVNIFIGLGHGHFRTLVDVLKNISELDVVVGSHSGHAGSRQITPDYAGSPPRTAEPDDRYPYVVKENAKNQLLVRGHAYGKYLGRLNLQFDENGDVRSWNGKPVLLDSRIKQDREMLDRVNHMAESLRSERSVVIGYTTHPLNGSLCRIGECPLGNMMADAVAIETKADIVVINSGGIRASIMNKNVDGGITNGELFNVHPFGDSIDALTLRGSVLKKVLEHSVSTLPEQESGRFLQVSGLRVRYNISRPVGERVVKAETRMSSSNGPSRCRDVEDAELYTVAAPGYLIDGGDGFSMLKDHESRRSGEKILSSVKRFMSSNISISPQTEGRIVVVK